MYRLFLNISLYWRCQILGWLSFSIILLIFDEIIYRDFFVFIPFVISIFIGGLASSHLLKLLIVRTGVLKKEFSSQVLIFSLFSILFSIIGTFIWMSILMKLGIWVIKTEANDRSSSYIRAYFFNLFPVLLTFSVWTLIYFLYHYVQGIRKEAILKSQYMMQMFELEAKALRSQMNPHFIFNCLNSIKSLIQNDEKQKATDYLITFSKLIRTLFQNSDKRQISLYDEVETCKWYIELESMRFDGKLAYNFSIDPDIDLKSIMVPALIMQPFLENAIWHGIIPKKNGGIINVTIIRKDETVVCSIEDNGIGRKMSKDINHGRSVIHKSKGISLIEDRLRIEELLNQTISTIEIEDKYIQEEAAGTIVKLTFNLM